MVQVGILFVVWLGGQLMRKVSVALRALSAATLVAGASPLWAGTAYAGALPSSDAPPVNQNNSWVQVSTPQQLEYIDQHQSLAIAPGSATTYLAANIELMNNIDLSGYTGWVPFGTSGHMFSGTFNGNGHVISGLTFSDTSNLNVGLFGTVTGNIENLGLEASVTVGSHQITGLLVGLQAAGNITNSFAAGTLNAGAFSTSGGLVGEQESTIRDVYTDVAITGGAASTNGGIIGLVYIGSLSQGYAVGKIVATSNPTVGGIAGIAEGAGSSSGVSISGMYFDEDTTGTTVGIPGGASGTGIGKTTASMQSQSTYGGWDFANTWGIASNINSGYPYLRAVLPMSPPPSLLPLAVGTHWAWNGQYGVPYNALQLAAVSGHGPYTWVVTGGKLPSGLSLSAGGVVSGIPNGENGTSAFTVKVTDATGATASGTLSVAIFAAPSVSISTTTLPAARVGLAYSTSLIGTGVSPLQWSLKSGSLPAGLSLNGNGTLSGMPTESGQFTFTIQVTDPSGSEAAESYTLDISKLAQDERILNWNGQTEAVPALVQQNTTYMPIWYLMQSLQRMGIKSSWDGQDWNLTTASSPGLGTISPGQGGMHIRLNGTLIANVDGVYAIDASTGRMTTYMPIWYLMQVLNRAGLQGTWDGTTWSLGLGSTLATTN